jgi:signal transduction histidine kinase
MKDFVESIAESVEENIRKNRQINLEVDEESFQSDPYWLGIGIKNLIQNAYIHGTGTIEVKGEIIKTNKKKKLFQITVRDEGQFQNTMHDGKKRSSGLGLGLKIVRQLARDLNGKLSIQKKPTVVTLKIEESALWKS